MPPLTPLASKPKPDHQLAPRSPKPPFQLRVRPLIVLLRQAPQTRHLSCRNPVSQLVQALLAGEDAADVVSVAIDGPDGLADSRRDGRCEGRSEERGGLAGCALEGWLLD